MSYWGYSPYVSVAEKKAKAEKKLAKLKKKNPNIKPVVIEGKAIARTWWGKSWNHNLERYADYANRIGRGRSYVRHSAVLDLQIGAGVVSALVQGTASKPYKIEIKIQQILPKKWRIIKKECEGRIDSLQELIMGNFPKALREIFMEQTNGLFPSPKEISFSCSCPDWADMCKHVAAALYGIGARLDKDPSLFFKLRKVDINDLIAGAVKDRTQTLLEKAKIKTTKVMDGVDLSEMFGIDLGTEEEASMPLVKKKLPKAVTKKKAKKKSAANVRQTNLSHGEIVLKAIGRSKKGVDLRTLTKKTGLVGRKLYNTVYQLLKNGKIVRIDRGIYKKAK